MTVDNVNIVHYIKNHKTGNSDTFIEFLKSLKATIYVNNAPIHVAKRALLFMEQENLLIIFGLSYTPQYNMIELFFDDINFDFYNKICINK